ncbi:hypothetical protein [Thiomicrospira pelophila]|uniref:hypothetical protein n=1 Tax=Thiomicrospira pelophila TaxID=934 RepID=UPI0004A732E0|nr:hypothetical protein [Thiomicrospira pelophila]
MIKSVTNWFDRYPKSTSLLLTLLIGGSWLLGFKYTEPWLQNWHLPLFGGVFLLAIFITVYRATRQLNLYLASVITDHPWVRWVIEARLSSLVIALLLAGILTISAMVLVYTASGYPTAWILLSGLTIVTLLMIKLTFQRYVKTAIHDFSRAYISVLIGALYMLVMQLTVNMRWPPMRFEPMSVELLEFVRASVNHSEILFQHIARTAMYIEHNILALAQIDGFSPWLVAVTLLLTTSIVPFMALALFIRSVYEGVVALRPNTQIKYDIHV